jgi:putative sterol carrier protein
LRNDGQPSDCEAERPDDGRFISEMKKIWVPILAVTLVAVQATAAPTGSHRGDNTLPQQVFDGMRDNFAAGRAHGVHVRYQFDLSGPNGGLWWIEVQDGKCKMGRGRIRNPGVTFIAADRDWVALSNGTLPGFWAFLTGRLKIHGDQKLARKLDELFNEQALGGTQ